MCIRDRLRIKVTCRRVRRSRGRGSKRVGLKETRDELARYPVLTSRKAKAPFLGRGPTPVWTALSHPPC
eukprot:1667046-Rhodomonas_salina.2